MKKYSILLESLPAKTVVFAFGRFNPPTTGHELLVKLVKKLAQSSSADHAIYASATQDIKKNPLSVDRKLHYLKLMFPGTQFYAAGGTQRTFIEAAKYLNKKYKNLIMVAGSDRVAEYQKTLEKYNGIEFHFDSIKVISAGERDPDADDAGGMSASKMRAAASKNDFATFKKGLPTSVREVDGKRLMNEIRVGLGLEAVKEQIMFGVNALREAYIRKEIFNIGDIIESANQQFEIVDRGSNYLTVVDGTGTTYRKWLQDCKVIDVVLEDIQPGYAPDEISFKGYTTKNLHHSGDAAKAFQETIERYGKLEPATVLAALKATDTYMKLNDMHLEQGKAPDQKELDTWKEAHSKARDSLNRIGEFLHHEDYWHMHEHELQDMETEYTPATAGAEMADSYEPQDNLVEGVQSHKVTVTVSDPNHTAVLQRNEKVMKRVVVNAGDKMEAVVKAKAFYKKKGLKVHDAEYHSMVPSSTMKTEELSTAARFNQKVKQATASHEAGDHKKAKYHLDLARNFMLGINSTDHSKIKDSYPKYKELRKIHEETIEENLTDKTIRSGNQLDEVVKIGTKVKLHYPGKDFHDQVGYVGEIRHGLFKGAPKKYTVDYGNGKSVQLDKKNIKVHKEEVELDEELSDKTIRSGDKVKVARVIADMLGVEKADSMTPEQAINAALHKIKNKRMTSDMVGVVKKMLALAREVGIKIDMSMVPKSVSEAVVGYKDFVRLKATHDGTTPALVDEDDLPGPNSQDDAPSAQKIASDSLEGQNHVVTTHGSSLGGSDAQHQRRKVLYKTEDIDSADFKVNPDTGRKSRAKHINFANSKDGGAPVQGDNGSNGSPSKKSPIILHKASQPMMKPVKEEVDGGEDFDMSEEEMDRLANGIETVDHIIDVYDEDELGLVDDETGESIKEEVEEHAEVLNEVLSRMERMRSRIRFARTASKRERRIKIVLKTRSTSKTINKRARRLAINMMKQRMFKKPAAQMTVSEKERAERIIATRKAVIDRLAMKLAPRIRNIEQARLSHSTQK